MIISYRLILSSATAGLLLAASSAETHAQANAYFWNYEGTGTAITTPSVNGTDNPSITDAHYAEIGGTNMADDQVTRWKHLLESGYAFGSNSSLTRAWDISEDWSVNWSTPGVAATAPFSRWSLIEIGTNSSTWSYKNLANVGPHANEPLLGNSHLIAIGDDSALFWDSDNTFSYYTLAGGLIADYSWTILNGGTLDGNALGESLLKEYFIGTEQGQIAFLVGPDQIDFYTLATGAFLRSADYSQITTGPLAGAATLEHLIDGKIEGYTYLGIDGLTPGAIIAGVEVIPEPSTWALFVGSAALLGALRRRKATA